MQYTQCHASASSILYSDGPRGRLSNVTRCSEPPFFYGRKQWKSCGESLTVVGRGYINHASTEAIRIFPNRWTQGEIASVKKIEGNVPYSTKNENTTEEALSDSDKKTVRKNFLTLQDETYQERLALRSWQLVSICRVCALCFVTLTLVLAWAL